MARAAVAAVVLVLLALGLLAGGPTGVRGLVLGTVEGPSAVAPGAAASFFVNVSGGPGSEAGGNFTARFYLTGEDLTDASPHQSSPRSDANPTGRFQLNITAPRKDQVVTLVVEVNSTAGTRFEKTTLSKAVTVITPIVLTATFTNDATSAAVNVPVKFYVDGKLVGQTNLSRIEPKGTGTATLSYLPVGLGTGPHSVRVEADVNGNGLIEADKGEVVASDLFHKKGFELSWGWALVIILATVSVSTAVIRASRRRRR